MAKAEEQWEHATVNIGTIKIMCRLSEHSLDEKSLKLVRHVTDRRLLYVYESLEITIISFCNYCSVMNIFENILSMDFIILLSKCSNPYVWILKSKVRLICGLF